MNTSAPAHVIDVRCIAPRERHATIFARFRALDVGAEMQIVNDHDPRPLYRQFQIESPGNFSWVYEQNGPELWRVAIRKLARAHGAGDCCGHCGGGA